MGPIALDRTQGGTCRTEAAAEGEAKRNKHGAGSDSPVFLELYRF